MSTPSIFELKDLFFDENKCISFLFENNIFYNERLCPSCGIIMKLRLNSNVFRCSKKTCRKAISIKQGSFFSLHKLSCSKILFLGYLWLNKVPVSSMILMTQCSSSTITEFGSYFRQLVSDSLDLEDATIGGEGIIVEIDETKLGKRKYHRGHRVEGVWVVGGIERTDQQKVFLVPVEDRTKDTLKNIISTHVLPGSIIHTDLWKGYSGLNEDGMYEHHTVNHSKYFTDPQTGVHTNTIEGTWNGLKMSIKPRNRTKDFVDDHLWEFIWRKKHAINLWLGFIDSLREIQYD